MALTRASLWHFRYLHLLVCLGVAVAVAVLAGALLVGSSVRASLRALAGQRLGSADIAISTTTSFSTRLGAAMAIAAPDTISGTSSLIAVSGTVAHAASGRMAATRSNTPSTTTGVVRPRVARTCTSRSMPVRRDRP